MRAFPDRTHRGRTRSNSLASTILKRNRPKGQNQTTNRGSPGGRLQLGQWHRRMMRIERWHLHATTPMDLLSSTPFRKTLSEKNAGCVFIHHAQ
jgi:hypothetical protein